MKEQVVFNWRQHGGGSEDKKISLQPCQGRHGEHKRAAQDEGCDGQAITSLRKGAADRQKVHFHSHTKGAGEMKQISGSLFPLSRL